MSLDVSSETVKLNFHAAGPAFRDRPPAGGAVWLRAGLVSAAGFLWVTLFWFQPAKAWPIRRQIDRIASELLQAGLGLDELWAWAVRSWVFVLVPLGVVRLAGKRPETIGLGASRREGWRIVAAGFVVSLPILMWLGSRPGIQTYYQRVFEPGGWTLIGAYVAVIIVEHIWIAGVVLALALPAGRLPRADLEPAPEGWLGIAPSAWPALIGQALVFGAIHVGKDPGELATSFPGGLALGILTYRVRSIWPSVVIHAATSATILFVAYVFWRMR